MPEICSVLMAEDLEARVSQELQSRLLPQVRLALGTVIPDPADFQILVAGRMTREMLTASPHLRGVIIPFAGIPAPTRELLMGFPHLTVHNLHHNAEPVAEMAIALLLASAKSILPLDRKLREGDWRPRWEPSNSLFLAGRTVVVLGMGAIGQRVAAMCKSMGMKVIGVRRDSAKPAPQADETCSLAELHRVLPRAAAMVVCLPLTESTREIVGEAELNLLPDHAVVVNIARGAVIQEQALFRELESGRLRAGLDVWYTYPTDEPSRAHTFPSNLPFHTLLNVVMTPHVASETDQTDSLWVADLARILNLAASGQPLPNRVDLQAGY